MATDYVKIRAVTYFKLSNQILAKDSVNRGINNHYLYTNKLYYKDIRFE